MELAILEAGRSLIWREIDSAPIKGADAVGIKAGSRIGTHAFRRSFAGRLRDGTCPK
jgi:hypothetical protein